MYVLNWVVTGLPGYWFGYCQPVSDRRLGSALRREARTDSPLSPSLPSGRPVVDEGDPLPKEKVETGAVVVVVVVVHGDDESRVEAPMLRLRPA